MVRSEQAESELADLNVALVGLVTSTTSSAASEGPVLLTDALIVRSEPAATVDGPEDAATVRSLDREVVAERVFVSLVETVSVDCELTDTVLDRANPAAAVAGTRIRTVNAAGVDVVTDVAVHTTLGAESTHPLELPED